MVGLDVVARKDLFCDFCYYCDYKTSAVFLAGYYFKPFSTIAINVYDMHALPDEEIILRDLKAALSSYRDYVEKSI